MRRPGDAKGNGHPPLGAAHGQRTASINGLNGKRSMCNRSGAANTLKIMVALNDGLLSAGIKFLLSNAGHDVVIAPQDPDGSLAAAKSMKPEIIILAQSSNAAGPLVESITRLQRLPTAPKVVLLLECAADTLEIANLDVEGIVMSSAQVGQFLECIESVAGGRRWLDPDVLSVVPPSKRRGKDCLTLRELQIAEGVVRGLRNQEIAREIGLREGTVKMHLRHIFEKLKLANRTQLALAFSSPDNAYGKGTQPRAD